MTHDSNEQIPDFNPDDYLRKNNEEDAASDIPSSPEMDLYESIDRSTTVVLCRYFDDLNQLPSAMTISQDLYVDNIPSVLQRLIDQDQRDSDGYLFCFNLFLLQSVLVDMIYYRQIGTPLGEEDETALLQTLIGNLQLHTENVEQQVVWTAAIENNILPECRFMDKAKLSFELERADAHEAAAAKDEEQITELKTYRQFVLSEVARLFVESYGEHDDVAQIARTITYAAELRTYEPDIYVPDLQPILDQYPMASVIMGIAESLFQEGMS